MTEMSEVNIDSAEVESVDIVSMISKERRDVYYAMKCSRVWKRAAKKHKAVSRVLRNTLELANCTNNLYRDRVQLAEALAADRLELLRRVEWALMDTCPICGKWKPGSTGGLVEIQEGHAAYCELAKELGDE